MLKMSPALRSSGKPLCRTEFRAISQRSTDVKCQICLAMLYLSFDASSTCVWTTQENDESMNRNLVRARKCLHTSMSSISSINGSWLFLQNTL